MMEWITTASGRFPEERRVVQVIGDFVTCGNLYAYRFHGQWYWAKTQKLVQIPLLAWGESKDEKAKKHSGRTTKELGHLPEMRIMIRIPDPLTGKEHAYDIDTMKVSFDENGERCLCIIPDVL